MTSGVDAPLREAYEAWLEQVAAGVAEQVPAGVRIDAHTHLGVDAGSGLEMTVEALERQMELAGADQAVVIPLNASDGYHRTNLRLARLAADSGGRFHALYRIDPRDSDLASHVAAGFAAGSVGLKLHPDSDGVDPLDPAIAPALELAEEHRALVLVHTGVDVERAAPATVEAARRYPGARFVLGHVPAEALMGTLAEASRLDNVWTCLSWWGALDVSIAVAASDPSRLLLGSDPPYGHMVTGLAQTVLVARALGLDDDAVRGIVGGNAQRLLDPTARPAPVVAPPSPSEAPDLLGGLPLALRRCYLGLLAAVAAAWSGGEPASYYRFAEQSLEPGAVPDSLAASAAGIRASVDLARALHEAGAREQSYAVGTVALTQALTAR